MKLLKHFKELSLYPKNAEELKGLILQLAVQGKLTANWREENPDIESATSLLEKIRLEREKLTAEKKIKKRKVIVEIEDQETLNELPINWQWCKLGDITDLPYGKNLSKKDIIDEGYDVFGANGVIGKYSSYLYEEQMLLISCRGAYSGKTNISPEKSFITSNSLVCEFFKPELTYYKFFYYAITALPKDKIVTGSAQPQVTATNAYELTIPLPPLEEQKAIVEVVNSLYKEVEQLETLTKERIQLKESFVVSALNRLNESENTQEEWNFLQQHFSSFFTEKKNIKSLRETILQLAVQGKLTENWRGNNPNIEPASELLKRIEAEKQQLIAEKKIKKEKPLPAIEEDEIPYELPKGWVWCRLTELVNVGTGSTPAKSNVSYYQGGTIPWYTSSATNDNYAKVQDVLITQKALDETNCKVFPSGSLIIALYGQGKTRGQISEVITPGATNQAIAAMVFFENSKGVKEYLKHFFKKIYHEIRQLAEGGAQPNLNVGKVKNTRVPLPPLEEIIEIVEKVNSLMALCDELEKQIETSQIQIEQLMQSCLKEVFQS